MPSLFPDEICIFKWFGRDPHDPATAAVSTGWIQALLGQVSKDLRHEPPATRFAHRMLLEQVTQAMAAREAFAPLTAGWWTEATAPDRRRMTLTRTMRVQREMIPLSAEPEAGRDFRPVYLYTENTQHDLRLDVEIGEDGGTTVTLRTAPAGGDSDVGATGADVVLEGYLYLRSLAEPGSRVFRLRCLSATPDMRDRIGRSVVIQDGRGHHQVPPSRTALDGAVAEFHYQHNPAASGTGTWFGIPFFSRCEVTLAQQGSDGPETFKKRASPRPVRTPRAIPGVLGWCRH